MSTFFFYSSGAHLDLHSFPTRRSSDLLRFYLEAYGERPGARWLARALDLGGHEIWHDTVALAGTQELSSGVAQLAPGVLPVGAGRSEEHTSELQSHSDLVCRLLLEKNK